MTHLLLFSFCHYNTAKKKNAHQSSPLGFFEISTSIRHQKKNILWSHFPKHFQHTSTPAPLSSCCLADYLNLRCRTSARLQPYMKLHIRAMRLTSAGHFSSESIYLCVHHHHHILLPQGLVRNGI